MHAVFWDNYLARILSWMLNIDLCLRASSSGKVLSMLRCICWNLIWYNFTGKWYCLDKWASNKWLWIEKFIFVRHLMHASTTTCYLLFIIIFLWNGGIDLHWLFCYLFPSSKCDILLIWNCSFSLVCFGIDEEWRFNQNIMIDCIHGWNCSLKLSNWNWSLYVLVFWNCILVQSATAHWLILLSFYYEQFFLIDLWTFSLSVTDRPVKHF